MALRLQTILRVVSTASNELKLAAAELKAEAGKRAHSDLDDLTVKAKNTITEKLLKLVSKLNE